MTPTRPITSALARQAPLLLLVAVYVTFGCMAPQFFALKNIVNIIVQSSSVAIVAVGMTFVLLTGGIDLSVGAIMFVVAVIAAKLALLPNPPAIALILMIALALGLFYGLLNAVLITTLGMMPFIVTLATLFMGRGLGLWITETRRTDLPAWFLDKVQFPLFGVVPVPLLVLAAVLFAAHVLLIHTSFGRQLYALGHDREAARKAGINISLLLACVYTFSGLCAAIAGVLFMARMGTVSSDLGKQYELQAIAATVLGGTSLFGGRGNVFPGALLGAVLIQSIESGLVMINANEYLYPMLIAAVIFVAVLIDRLRHAARSTPSRLAAA